MNVCPLDDESLRHANQVGFYSVLYFVQALTQDAADHSLDLIVLTSNSQMVTGEERLEPQRPRSWACAKSFPRSIRALPAAASILSSRMRPTVEREERVPGGSSRRVSV
jgi:hypothetical protein